MTRLILIRHGETEWNLEGRWQGQADVPLSARGREQAEAMARSLADQSIDAIYTSDLRRAQETAQAIADTHELPLHTDSRLREIDQGEWEGMLYTEIQARYADRLKQRRMNPWKVAPPGGETAQEVRDRVMAAVEDITRKHPGRAVVVVSHGFALAVLLATFRDYPIEKVWDLVPNNCDPLMIESEPDSFKR